MLLAVFLICFPLLVSLNACGSVILQGSVFISKNPYDRHVDVAGAFRPRRHAVVSTNIFVLNDRPILACILILASPLQTLDVWRFCLTMNS